MRKIMLAALLALLLSPALAMAQEATVDANQNLANPGGGSFVFPGGTAGIVFGACIGVGLVVIGAARGVGNIGAHATDAIARQPEAGGRIFTTMIISAALIEGFTLFAVVICLLAVLGMRV
jgi:F-type H+-transporting ATPase subunit c